jgi:hypothetical protein
MIYTYSDLFNSLPIKDQAEAERLLNGAFAIMCYLKEGDRLRTAFAEFTKISGDLIIIDHKKNYNLILDELEKNNIAKLT